MKTKKSLLASLVALMSGLAAVSAVGADADRSRTSLEEIVVTAQKREESLQDVPIAINAMSADSLSASGISDSNDLPILSPSLQYYRAVGSASPFIRGIGALNTAVGGEGSVSTYVDGVYMREMYAVSQNFNNVERVEILNGPQGTLFGRNSTGGLIQTVTKTPTQESEMILGLDVGNFDAVSGDFYGTTGISDNVAADLAIAFRNQGEGYGKNLTTGNELGYQEYTQVRSKWLISPSDATDITLTLQWADKEDDFGQARTCAPGGICFGFVPPTQNFEDAYGNTDGYNESEGWLGAVRIEHQFESVDFMSLTSYQDFESFGQTDVEGSPFLAADYRLRQFSETFSQEFQIQSSYESPLQWIAGVFYWDDTAEWNPGATDPVTHTLTTPGGTIDIYDLIETKSYAVFGQLYYNFTEATQLTLGYRWTRDEKEFTGKNTFFLPAVFGPSPVDVPFPKQDATFTEPSLRVALSHHFNEDIMGYVSYNQSFKSGAFPTVVTNGMPRGALEPETLDAYAVGMKGDFLDGRLRLNAEAFYYEIENLQLRTQLEDGSVDVFNAASGEMMGFEVQATALMTDNFSAQVNYAFLDSEYKSFPGCPAHTPSVTANGGFGGNLLDTSGNCDGNSMINAPESTLSVVLNHFLPTEVGTFNSALTYYYNDGFFVGPDEGHNQPEYDVVNASITWSSVNEKYQVGLYGNNLTEEHYSSGYDLSEFGNLVPVAMYPREYGLKFKMTVN